MPRQFPLVPIPQPPPVNIASLAYLARMDREDQRAEEARRQAEETTALMNQAMTTAQGSPDRAADWLAQQGRHDLAMGLREQTAERRHTAQERAEQRYKTGSERLQYFGRVMRPIQMAKDDDAVVSAYAAIEPELRRVDHPDVQRRLPDPTNATAIRQFAETAVPWTMTNAEVLKQRAAWLEQANRSPQKDQDMLKLAGNWVTTVQTGKELQDALSDMRDLYVPAADVVARMVGDIQPGPLSQERVSQLAQRFGVEPESPPRPPGGDFAQALRRREDEIGRKMRTDEVLAFRRDWSATSRAPGQTGASEAQLGARARRLGTALNEIRLNAYLTDEEKAPATLTAYNAYREAQGWPLWATLPAISANEVVVRTKDGKELTIARSDLDAAQQDGAVLVYPR